MTTAELPGPRYARTALDRLAPHLEHAYDITVTDVVELDLGVFRVDRIAGSSWVARVFPAVRPADAAEGDADVLRYAAARDFPAERLARPDPVSIQDGQAVLVTEHVDGARGEQRRSLLTALGGQRRLGELLGDLHLLPAAGVAGDRPGGAWHHLADGAPAAELAAARRQLADALERLPAAHRSAEPSAGPRQLDETLECAPSGQPAAAPRQLDETVERVPSGRPATELSAAPRQFAETAERVPPVHRSAELSAAELAEAAERVPAAQRSAELSAAELAEAVERVPAAQRSAAAALRAELDDLDDGAGLPEALLHPDFVLANVVASPERGMVLVDWTGAGRGPRLWSLAFLLWAAGAASPGRVDRVVAGYRSRLRPDPAELARLPGLIRARPVIFASWAFCVGRQDITQAAQAAAQAREQADAIAARALAAFA
jgi:hypothetical protein